MTGLTVALVGSLALLAITLRGGAPYAIVDLLVTLAIAYFAIRRS